MSDNKTKTAPQDADRINVNEDYEVKYWTGKYGVTPDRLKAAVKKVGVMAKDVEAELKRR
jgi:DNA-binding protein H-NS